MRASQIPRRRESPGGHTHLYAQSQIEGDRLPYTGQLIAETGSPLKPERVARVIRVTMEGVWLDIITMSAPYSRLEALRTIYTCAMALFPQYFDDKGLRK